MPPRRLPSPHGYLTIAKAAEWLGISRQALHDRCKAGTMPGARRIVQTRTRWLIAARAVRDEIKRTGGRRGPWGRKEEA